MEWENGIPADEGVLLSLAVFLGHTRLIDNFPLYTLENSDEP
jgi:hypothetical protein